MKGDISQVLGVGELLLKQLVTYASGEGYKGDEAIFTSVYEELKRFSDTIIIEICYSARTVAHIEASFLFKEQETLIDGEGWLGGYLHTVEVTRRDEIETHSATVLRGSTGKRAIIDWLTPSIWPRDDDRENLMHISRWHASQAFEQSREHMKLMKKAVEDTIEFPVEELKRCHIPKSGMDRIISLVGTSNVTRYQLVKACTEYASELDYEVADLYWRTAGRLLKFGE